MNIFFTSFCPEEAARFLDDKRVVKMVLETTQLLCTALNVRAGAQITPYKSTHVNHPCSKWARLSSTNWNWLLKHGLALSREYRRRYGKVHKCEEILSQIAPFVDSYIPPIGGTPPPNCAANKSLGLDMTHIEDINEAYASYMEQRWKLDKREPTWYGKKRPSEWRGFDDEIL